MARFIAIVMSPKVLLPTVATLALLVLFSVSFNFWLYGQFMASQTGQAVQAAQSQAELAKQYQDQAKQNANFIDLKAEQVKQLLPEDQVGKSLCPKDQIAVAKLIGGYPSHWIDQQGKGWGYNTTPGFGGNGNAILKVPDFGTFQVIAKNGRVINKEFDTNSKGTGIVAYFWC